MLTQDFISQRIAQLRQATGASARDMSLTLRQAENYINNIENKRTMPSVPSLLCICDYLRVSPQEFFDEGNKHPARINALVTNLKFLDATTLTHIEGIVRVIVKGIT